MIVKTAKLGPFLGMNNRLPRYALQTPESGSYVVDALGVDIDITGRLSRADGSTSVAALTTGRSLFSDGTRMLYADGTSLYKIDTLSPFAATAIDTVAAHALSYEAINGEIFYTDGSKLSCLDATNTVRPVGVPVPASLTLASTAGTLPAASYQCTITYFNGVGRGRRLRFHRHYLVGDRRHYLHPTHTACRRDAHRHLCLWSERRSANATLDHRSGSLSHRDDCANLTRLSNPAQRPDAGGRPADALARIPARRQRHDGVLLRPLQLRPDNAGQELSGLP